MADTSPISLSLSHSPFWHLRVCILWQLPFEFFSPFALRLCHKISKSWSHKVLLQQCRRSQRLLLGQLDLVSPQVLGMASVEVEPLCLTCPRGVGREQELSAMRADRFDLWQSYAYAIPFYRVYTVRCSVIAQPSIHSSFSINLSLILSKQFEFYLCNFQCNLTRFDFVGQSKKQKTKHSYSVCVCAWVCVAGYVSVYVRVCVFVGINFWAVQANRSTLLTQSPQRKLCQHAL